MLLDISWQRSAIKKVGNYNSDDYLIGVEDFQKKAIEELEYKILEARNTNSGSITGLLESINILKNLKK